MMAVCVSVPIALAATVPFVLVVTPSVVVKLDAQARAVVADLPGDGHDLAELNQPGFDRRVGDLVVRRSLRSEVTAGDLPRPFSDLRELRQCDTC